MKIAAALTILAAIGAAVASFIAIEYALAFLTLVVAMTSALYALDVATRDGAAAPKMGPAKRCDVCELESPQHHEWCSKHAKNAWKPVDA